MKYFYLVCCSCILFACQQKNTERKVEGDSVKDIAPPPVIPTLHGEKLHFKTWGYMFYLHDKKHLPSDENMIASLDGVMKQKLVEANGVVGVQTGIMKGMDIETINVNTEVAILDTVPEVKYRNEADHIVEGSLMIESGVLKITNNDVYPKAVEVFSKNLKKGKYRIRIYFFRLGYDENSLIEIWPSEKDGKKVVKQFNN